MTVIPFIMTTLTKTILSISSSAYPPGGHIPSKYTCEGDNVNPPLYITGMPSGTKSLVVIMEDPDAVNGTFDHWVIWNISPTETIKENSAPGLQGRNSAGNFCYTGPCPPNGVHHYNIKVFALDSMLGLEVGASKTKVLTVMEGHVIASGVLMGLYKKIK
jgi:Raf kinase inhibitor-like YbhB/YbcL family protein